MTPVNFGLEDVAEDLHVMHNESPNVDNDANAMSAIELNEVNLTFQLPNILVMQLFMIR